MRLFALVVPLGIAGLALAPKGHAQMAESPKCAWQIEYATTANLRLTETPNGAGDGVYAIGPGMVVLRFDDVGGRPGGNVQMLRYTMRENFTIHSKTLFWTTTVVTDSNTNATPNACSIAAEGVLSGQALQWRTPIAGYRTDGTITCSGSLCGKFGAPPPGQMALHIPPHPVQFKTFSFGPDMRTFGMESTHVSKTTMPKQSADVSLSGREVRRACVPVRPCGKSGGT